MSRVAYAGYNYGVSPAVGLAGIADFNGSAISHFGTDNTGVTSDTKVFWFKNAANQDRVLIAETQYDSSYNPLPSLFTVVDGSDLTSVKGVSGATWGTLVNVYALIRQGDYLVGIDYDEFTVFRVLNSSGDTYTYQTTVFTLDLSDADLNPAIATPYPSQKFGVDLSTDGTNIFALFIKGNNVYGGNYDPSLIVKLNLDLTLATGTGVVNNTGASLAKNAFSLQKYANDLYVVSVGGMQNYGSTNGSDSKIQKVAKSTMATTDLLVGGSTQALGDFRGLSFRDDGTEAFILTGAYNTGGATFTGKLYRTTMTALAGAGGGNITSISGIVSTDITTIPGYLWSLLYSQEEDMTWMARGNDLAVYKYNPPVPVPPTPASVTVVDAKNINTLSGVTPPVYSLNAVTLYNNIKVQTLRGAAQPAMASNSARALIEREKLLANTKK